MLRILTPFLLFFTLIVSANTEDIITYNAEYEEISTFNIIQSVQDYKNYIWTITSSGAYRFDGVRNIKAHELFDLSVSERYKHISINDKKTIIYLISDNNNIFTVNIKTGLIYKAASFSQDTFVSLYKVNNKYIYISDKEIIFLTEKLVLERRISFFQSNSATILTTTSDDRVLYLGTDNGLFEFGKITGFIRKHKIFDGQIYDVAIKNNTLALNINCEFLVYSLISHKTSKVDINQIKHNQCPNSKIDFIKDKVIVTVPSFGMFFWEQSTNTTQPFQLALNKKFILPSPDINHILITNEGVVFSVNGLGIILLPNEQLNFQTTYRSKVGDSSHSYTMVQSTEDTIWMSFNDGIRQFDYDYNLLQEVDFANYPSIPNGSFSTFALDEDSNLLWGFNEEVGTLFTYNIKTKEIDNTQIEKVKELGFSLSRNVIYIEFDNRIAFVDPTTNKLKPLVKLKENSKLIDHALFDDKTIALLYKDVIEFVQNEVVISKIPINELILNEKGAFDLRQLIILNSTDIALHSPSSGVFFININSNYEMEDHYPLNIDNHTLLNDINTIQYSIIDQTLYAITDTGLYNINVETFEIFTIIDNQRFWHDEIIQIVSLSNALLILNKQSITTYKSDTDIMAIDRKFDVSMIKTTLNNLKKYVDYKEGDINIDKNDDLDKIFLTQQSPFTSSHVKYFYQINNNKKLWPVGDDQIIHFSSISDEEFYLTIIACFNSFDTLEKSILVTNETHWIESKLFRRALGCILIILFLIFTSQYFKTKKRKTITDQKENLLAATFSNASTPQFVLNSDYTLLLQNDAFSLLFNKELSSKTVLDLIPSLSGQHKWIKNLERAKTQKHWSGNLLLNYKGEDRHFFTSITYLKKPHNKYVVSISEFDPNSQNAVYEANSSRSHLISVLEQTVIAQHAIIILRYTKRVIEFKVIKKVLEGLQYNNVIKTKNITTINSQDVAILIKFYSHQDLFLQILNVENELNREIDAAHYHLGISLRTKESIVFSRSFLEEAESALVGSDGGTSPNFSNEQITADYFRYCQNENAILNNILQSRELYLSPLVDSKTGEVSFIEISNLNYSTSNFRQTIFMSNKSQKLIFAVLIEDIIEQIDYIEALQKKIMLPIPINYLLHSFTVLKPFISQLSEKHIDIRLLIECQNIHQLSKYYYLFNELKSSRVSFYLAIDDVFKVSGENLVRIQPDGLIVDTYSMKGVTSDYNATVDGLVAICISLGIEIGLGGINNQNLLLLKNKGFSLLSGSVISEQHPLRTCSSIVNKNYLDKIVSERLRIERIR